MPGVLMLPAYAFLSIGVPALLMCGHNQGTNSTCRTILTVLLVIEALLCLFYLRKRSRAGSISRFLVFIQNLYPMCLVFTILVYGQQGNVLLVLFMLHNFLLCFTCLIFYQNRLITSAEIHISVLAPYRIIQSIIYYGTLCALAIMLTLLNTNAFPVQLIAIASRATAVIVFFAIFLSSMEIHVYQKPTSQCAAHSNIPPQ